MLPKSQEGELSRGDHTGDFKVTVTFGINFRKTKTNIVYLHISGGENGNPLQYSCLENSMDKGAWWATVHGVTKSRKWLCNKPHIDAYMCNLGEGNGNPLQYSCLENSRDRAAWSATVCGVLKSWTGGGNGNALQHSCLEDPMDRGAWRAAVYGVTRVRHD